MRALVLVCFLLVLFVLGTSAKVMELTSANFQESITDPTKNYFVKFYAPWCGHCQSLAPVWQTLSESFPEDGDVVIAHVNLEENRDVAEDQGIQGLPTLKLFRSGEDKEPMEYHGGRDESSLRKFVNENKN